MKILNLLGISIKSSLNRKFALGLMVFSVALSTLLLIGIQKIKTQADKSFTQSISGTDLIVGARGSDIQLMLYSIFHLGKATNNMGVNSWKNIANNEDVEWTIPISLGDSHKGFSVVATNKDYFDKYKYQYDKNITIKEGNIFDGLFDTVIGYRVAKSLNYKIGDKIILAHGNNATNLTLHADKPFFVVGILNSTGTPVDDSIYISLEAMEAIHIDWIAGAPMPGFKITAEQVEKMNLKPKSITALLVGLKNKMHIFSLQRQINYYNKEALSAVMPGVALNDLWRMLNVGEKSLIIISFLVMITGVVGLMSTILAGLNERRRELAILRSIGARPFDILLLLTFEGIFIMIFGIILGYLALSISIISLSPFILNSFGIIIKATLPNINELYIIVLILSTGFFASLIPAIKAYKLSLTDGLNN